MAGCASASQESSDTSTESSAIESPGFDSSENIPEAIYGPPEMLNGNEAFNPEANQNEDVYGPPEMLGALDGSSDGGASDAASTNESGTDKSASDAK